MQSVILSNFKSVLPARQVSQSEACLWALTRYVQEWQKQGLSEKEMISRTHLFQRVCAKAPQIEFRWTDRSDVETMDFAFTTPSDEFLENLMTSISKVFLEAGKKLYHGDRRGPEHIIHTTCTGYQSPNAVQILVSEKGWPCKVTNAYQMGCYAAFPSLRMAAGFVASGDASVDIVHNELCSLHFNPKVFNPEKFVVHSLFADGHIKYTISKQNQSIGLALHGLEETIIPGTLDAMSWVPGGLGFQMTLARQVPSLIVAEIQKFLPWFMDRYQINIPLKEILFAIHPGGPKIIDTIQQALGLGDDQVKLSRDVLRERGNMSSATLPHIWKKILECHADEAGRAVISLAFGPGLTIFASVATIVGAGEGPNSLKQGLHAGL